MSKLGTFQEPMQVPEIQEGELLLQLWTSTKDGWRSDSWGLWDWSV